MENNEIKIEHIPSAVLKLRQIFDSNKDKRICVVGPSCIGKTTLLKYLPDAVDMDELIFGSQEKNIAPSITKEEIDYVSGSWTPEIGKFMTEKARGSVEIKPGVPVFGTVVFPADLIVELTLPDEKLREYIRRRDSNEIDVFNMKKQIEDEIKHSLVPSLKIENM